MKKCLNCGCGNPEGIPNCYKCCSSKFEELKPIVNKTKKKKVFNKITGKFKTIFY